MLAKMTLVGLYMYDTTLFDNMVFPDGIDHEKVVDSVLDKGSEFGVLYANPEFMKLYLERWAKRKYSMIERWRDVLALEYDANRDYYWKEEENETKVGESEKDSTDDYSGSSSISGTNSNTRNIEESETVNTEGKETGTKSGTDSSTKEFEDEKNTSGTSKETGTSSEQKTTTGTSSEEKSGTETENGTTSDNTENKVSAFDSSSYSPRDMSTSSGTTGNSKTTGGTTSGETSGSETVTGSTGKDVTESGKETDKGKETITGTTGENSEVIKTGKNETKGTGKITDAGTSSESVTDGHKNVGNVTDEYSENVQRSKDVVGSSGKYSVQELLEQELELRSFVLEEKIADWLIQDICIMVY